ncbi:uncharacterized protein BJ212DRAFT_1484460 [Suillus subaureus]|uniref:Uncharacterized protein n=1 Tax=Suillus subaureus TaxID=48587 RepID=A0A9P7J8U1_9AGAM|nr:uncharacterized protein BJ212DRAFT_1484460 [Suillus subaureus]KAG1809333.1 hypothetical protein BJ212DRAFT_1484460 [Suillus subaureus]
MSFVVPWDGAYRVQNVAYPKQKIGLRFHDIIVAGRHEDSAEPRIEEIKATSVSDYSKITIQSGSRYVGADSEKVVYNTLWVGCIVPRYWQVDDTASGLLMYLPNGDDGAEVQLTQDGAGEVSYWRFIPIRPPSN